MDGAGPAMLHLAAPATLLPMEALSEVRVPLAVVDGPGGARHLAAAGETYMAPAPRGAGDRACHGILPALYPEWLGDRGFAAAHGCRFPYVVGEMAQGITTARMVVRAVEAGCVGFFGSAGLRLDAISEGIAQIVAQLGPDRDGWGANLIHTPEDPAAEDRVVDIFLEGGVRRMSASAFMALSPAVVRYAATGLTRGPDGRVVRRNHVFAKVSRVEVAEPFLSPAPERILRDLVAQGRLTAEEASLAAEIPVAGDLTAESDSGGHTDNRPLGALLPTLLELRDRLSLPGGDPVRVGAAGGLGTPRAIAAAFQMGAAYVLTGSVNQCAVESGLSEGGRAMLRGASMADVTMAPAADMFERGIKVQVLRRGTMFAARAGKLYELYRGYGGLEDIPAATRAELERTVFRQPIEDVWAATRAYFLATQPEEAERAERDPRHRMALVFRWYLFNSANWARAGDEARQADYQVWCGPAMGSFNDWVRGTALDPLDARTVGAIALNLLEGAAVATRAQAARTAGVAVPESAFAYRPRLPG